MSADHPTDSPAPWVIRRRREYTTIYSRGRDPVCDVEIWNEADAFLMSAAPLLLAALKKVVAIADRKTAEFDEAKAAIALAEGREEPLEKPDMIKSYLADKDKKEPHEAAECDYEWGEFSLWHVEEFGFPPDAYDPKFRTFKAGRARRERAQ